MPIKSFLGKPETLSRRQLLQFGLAGTGIAGVATIAVQALKSQSASTVKVPPIPSIKEPNSGSVNPMTILRDFDYGTVKREQGRTILEFRITAGTSTLQLNQAVAFNTWNFNNRVPGPTLRAKQGDRVRVLFLNSGGHSHSMHFHGVHRAEEDGIRPIRHGAATIYEFDAEPFGVHLYHCHVEPITRHIGRGLYGMFIIDPPKERPPADEIVLVMGGYDVDEDKQNEFYAFNGQPDYYMMHPIPIYQNQLIRLFVIYANELYQGIASQMSKDNPEVAKGIETNMSELIKAWPAAIPPAKLAKTPEQVSQIVKTIEQNSQKAINSSNTSA